MVENYTPSDSSPDKDIVVVFLTKTPEKTYHFQVIAENSRAAVIDIHRLAEGYTVAPEDTGDRIGNAHQKADAVVVTIEKLKTPGTIENMNLRAQFEVMGIPYDESKIFVAVEDSTFTVAPKVWPFLREKLKGLVSDDLLARYGGEEDSGNVGPGAETGPMVAAVGGWLRFYSLLRQATHEAQVRHGGRIDVGINSQCTVVIRQLTDPERKFTYEAALEQRLLEIAEGEDYEKHQLIIDPYDYLALPERGNTPISGYGEEFAKELSVRAQVFHQIERDLFAHIPTESAISLPDAHGAAADLLTRPAAPKQTKEVTYEKTVRQKIYDLIKCDLLGDVGAEGITLKPFDPKDYQARLNAYKAFLDILVAKQLDARDMFKPVVVWNDGCYRALIRTLVALANKGMAKDYAPFAHDYSGDGIQHFISSFFDVLSYDGQQYHRSRHNPVLLSDDHLSLLEKDLQTRLQEKTSRIIKERQRGYHDFIQPDRVVRQEGTTPDADRFTVAHFISASSDNDALIKSARHFGTYLADCGAQYVWGGMNMHAGGAGFEAYKKAGGVHASAFSTVPIAAAETEDGRLPENADYRDWAPDIYDRMAGMIAASDVIVVSPGGWGTFQELVTLLYLKEASPELFADKKIIIHNPNIHESLDYSGSPFWGRAIQSVLNVENRNRDFTSTTDKSIYIVHNDEELTRTIDDIQTRRGINHGFKYLDEALRLMTNGSNPATTPQPA